MLEDLRRIKERDPAARSLLEIFFLYSGFHALMWYRVAHFFHKIRFYFIARLLSQLGKFFTGVEIHPAAKIGKGLFIDHGTGIVIGETAEIGDNCTLYQGVTLGGTGKDVGKRHPTLADNVLVGAGAKVLGPFRVGNNVKIAAGAVVLSEIPDDCTAVGVPARVVKRGGKREDMDQIHIPDPISQEFCRLQGEVDRLKSVIEELLKMMKN